MSNNIEISSLNNNEIKTPKENYHPIEFYSLGKPEPKQLEINICNNNNNIKKINPNLNYNRSSHELFKRNILSVNHPYFDKYKEVKPRYKFNSSEKNETNYLEPLSSFRIRNEQIKENQKQNNINSLQWLHVINKKVYISDKDSKIKKGNNITISEFYKEKGINNMKNNKNNNSEGLDFHSVENKNLNRIFSIKRFKISNPNLLKEKELFPKEKEIEEIEKDNNYWRKLRIENNCIKNNTCINNSSDIKKFNEKKLKENFLYFDKNYTNIIRHKNWWKIDP